VQGDGIHHSAGDLMIEVGVPGGEGILEGGQIRQPRRRVVGQAIPAEGRHDQQGREQQQASETTHPDSGQKTPEVRRGGRSSFNLKPTGVNSEK
jgi:hypothetical protein